MQWVSEDNVGKQFYYFLSRCCIDRLTARRKNNGKIFLFSAWKMKKGYAFYTKSTIHNNLTNSNKLLTNSSQSF